MITGIYNMQAFITHRQNSSNVGNIYLKIISDFNNEQNKYCAMTQTYKS